MFACNQEIHVVNGKNEQRMQPPGTRFTLRMAIIVTIVSLTFLILGTAISVWLRGIGATIGGLFGLIGLTGLAQAVIIALAARRR